MDTIEKQSQEVTEKQLQLTPYIDKNGDAGFLVEVRTVGLKGACNDGEQRKQSQWKKPEGYSVSKQDEIMINAQAIGCTRITKNLGNVSLTDANAEKKRYMEELESQDKIVIG
jgi:hypothetical protein